MMKITIHSQIKRNLSLVRKMLKEIFLTIDEPKSMEIVFVSLEAIKRLNSVYRNKDQVTDVLSFVNEEDEDSLGDIFIAYEQAEKQSEEYGHSLMREIGFLAVHGYLHLIGYDHQTKDDEMIMIQEQERILKRANLERT